MMEIIFQGWEMNFKLTSHAGPYADLDLEGVCGFGVVDLTPERDIKKFCIKKVHREGF